MKRIFHICLMQINLLQQDTIRYLYGLLQALTEAKNNDFSYFALSMHDKNEYNALVKCIFEKMSCLI